MSFQYQAPADRSLFGWQFATTPPKNMGQPNVKPGGQALFICRDPEADPEADPRSRRHASLGRYGLSTEWAQDADVEYQYLCMAMVETAEHNKSFREVWASGRHCVVPVQSFQKSRKTQRWPARVRISAIGDEPLGIAGLWSVWTNRAGVTTYSFALLSTSADSHPVMRHFKYQDQPPRMPLIVHKSQYDAWLDVSPEKSMRLVREFREVELRTGSLKERCDSL